MAPRVQNREDAPARKRRSRVTKAVDSAALPDEAAVDVTTESDTDTETSEQKTATEAKRKKLEQLRKQFRSVNEYEQHFRTNAVDDMKFRIGTWGEKSFQWLPGVEEQRRADSQVVVTINRMPAFIRLVTNQARNAHLRIQVNPVDDHGDPKVAEVLQGIIRNIETSSVADWAYNAASDKQAEMGRGVFRLVTEWAVDDPDELRAPGDFFRQRIKIRQERDPLSIYVDSTALDADYGDAKWGLKVFDLDLFDFEDRFGIKAPDDLAVEAFCNEHENGRDWFPNGKTRVVEWFNLEPKGERIQRTLLSDGEIVEGMITDEHRAQFKELGVHVVLSRKLQKKVMMWRFCTALDILEETEWVDRSIPWCFVIGDRYEVDGEVDFRGVVRDSKDAARVYNAEVAGLVQGVAMGVKSPLVGYKGQFGAPGSDQRKAWESAHKKPYPFLEVDPIDIDGKPAGLPEPAHFEPPLQGTIMAIQQSDQDLKSTAGFRDASLAERGPQESGKAIIARQRQDELQSSHYLDNARLSLAGAGRKLIRMIRKVIDVPTVMRITGKDERDRKVLVFSGTKNDPRRGEDGNPDPNYTLPDGVAEIYDIGVGEFDVEVTAGSDSGSRRQEAVQAMTQLFSGLPPEISAKFLDLYFLVMDFPMAHQLAARAKKLMPPELQDEDEGGAKDVPPQVQAQMAALKQQLMQAMQMLQQAQEAVKGEKLKIQSTMLMKQEEIRSRERIEQLKVQRDLLMQKIDLKAEAALTLLGAEIARMEGAAEHWRTKDLQMIDATVAALSDEADRDHDHATRLLEASLTPEPPPAAPGAEPPAAAATGAAV